MGRERLTSAPRFFSLPLSQNVLLKHPAKSALKVIDFGSSCFEHEKGMCDRLASISYLVPKSERACVCAVYTYIQSRFYRSPEVILGMNYHMAIDMWSLGCILAELYTGFPIFPGENEQEQLSCIMEVLGVPDKDLINRSSRKKLFFGQSPFASILIWAYSLNSSGFLLNFSRSDSTGAPRPVVNSKGKRRRPGSKTLAQVLRCDDEVFIDFIAKCLHWDPERRLKPQTAMRHPFITVGRRGKGISPAASAARSLLASTTSLSGRGKQQHSQQQHQAAHQATETPKKSLIGAPTPLTARVPARAPTATIPATPIGTPGLHSQVPTTGASHRSYRNTQSGASYHHSSRNLAGAANGYTVRGDVLISPIGD